MYLQDFTNFILKHKSTLEMLKLSGIEWVDGEPSVLGWFYGELSDANQLEEIQQNACLFVEDLDVEFGIPKHLLTPWSDDRKDEDGFVEVHRPGTDIHHRGKNQVKKVLEECAFSMQST